MANDLIPAFAALLVAALCAYFTLHERAASSSASHVPDSGEWSREQVPAAPGPRDRCECGHTYDWHHSCARDICGCREFSFLSNAREQRHEAA